MTKKKRMSLSEIKKSDEIGLIPEKVDIEMEKITQKSSFYNDVDITKLSVVIPLSLFEEMQDISRKRRRDKQPFKISDMVREALSLWLEGQKQN